MSPLRHILHVGTDQGDGEKIERFLKNELSFQSQVTRADTFSKAVAHLKKHVFDLAVVEEPLPDARQGDLFKVLDETAPDLPLLVLAEKKPEQEPGGRKIFLVKKDLRAETFIAEVLKVWKKP